MRYYPPFRAVIPHFRAGHLRVTQPSATNRSSKPDRSVRLACLMHPASVCPEPGSNSPNKKKQWSCPRAPPPFTGSDVGPLTRVVPVTLQLLRSRPRGSLFDEGLRVRNPLAVSGSATSAVVLTGLAGDPARMAILRSAPGRVKRPVRYHAPRSSGAAADTERTEEARTQRTQDPREHRGGT